MQSGNHEGGNSAGTAAVIRSPFGSSCRFGSKSFIRLTNVFSGCWVRVVTVLGWPQGLSFPSYLFFLSSRTVDHSGPLFLILSYSIFHFNLGQLVIPAHSPQFWSFSSRTVSHSGSPFLLLLSLLLLYSQFKGGQSFRLTPLILRAVSHSGSPPSFCPFCLITWNLAQSVIPAHLAWIPLSLSIFGYNFPSNSIELFFLLISSQISHRSDFWHYLLLKYTLVQFFVISVRLFSSPDSHSFHLLLKIFHRSFTDLLQTIFLISILHATIVSFAHIFTFLCFSQFLHRSVIRSSLSHFSSPFSTNF